MQKKENLLKDYSNFKTEVTGCLGTKSPVHPETTPLI